MCSQRVDIIITSIEMQSNASLCFSRKWSLLLTRPTWPGKWRKRRPKIPKWPVTMTRRTRKMKTRVRITRAKTMKWMKMRTRFSFIRTNKSFSRTKDTYSCRDVRYGPDRMPCPIRFANTSCRGFEAKKETVCMSSCLEFRLIEVGPVNELHLLCIQLDTPRSTSSHASGAGPRKMLKTVGSKFLCWASVLLPPAM